jgi:hypothetical protein
MRSVSSRRPGAQGELLGMQIVRAHHVDHGNARRRVLIPSSAHGTNPASAALCGYAVTEVPIDARGLLTAEAIARVMDESVAALMVTNPNTLGLFEEEIEAVAAVVHGKGGLVYMDGANMNAIMGVAAGRRHGRRRDAVQSPQDVLDAARRRRPWRRSGPRSGHCSSTTCRCRGSYGAGSSSCGRTTPRRASAASGRSTATSAS